MFAAARTIARQFADNGVSSIAVAYFNTSETSKDLAEIPVEIIEHSADWLRGRGFKKVAVYGISKGAEYALLAASYISQLNAVIAVSPSCCVFEGLTKNKRPAAKSSWSWKGNPVPYISFGEYIPRFLSIFRKNKEIRFVDEYNSLLDTEMNESNMIKVENISGPILLLSAHEDAMWPSERMGNLIVNRLRDKKVKFQYHHEVYQCASHFLCPIYTPLSRIFKTERSYRKECNTSRENAFKLSLVFLQSI